MRLTLPLLADILLFQNTRGRGFWTQSGVCLQALGETCVQKQAKCQPRGHEKKVSLSRMRFPFISVARDLMGAIVIA